MASNGALGRLNVALGLDSTEFTRGLTKSEYASKQSMGKIAADAKKVALALGAMGVAAGAAMAILVKKSIDNMDAMSKLAQSTGTTVESLSALTYAADLSGVSQEAFGGSLIKLAKNMDDAASGTGEAIKAFNQLGIAVTNSDGTLRNSDEALGDIADRFAKMESGAKKTALAVQLFGRSGAQLIPLLNSGRDGLMEMKDEAARLGVVMDTDAARAAEAFNDNLTRLKKASDGFVIQMTNELMPTLQDLSDTLTSEETKAAFAEFVRMIAGATKAFVDFMSVINEGSFWGWLQTSGADAKNAEAEIDKLEVALSKLKKTRQAFDDSLVPNWMNADDIAILNTQIAATESKLGTLRVIAAKNRADADRVMNRSVEASGYGVGELPPILVKPSAGGGSSNNKKPTKAKIEDPLGVFIKDQNIDYAMGEYQRYLDFIDEATGRTQAKQLAQQREWLSEAVRLGQISTDEYVKAMDAIAKKAGETTSAMDQFAVQAARGIQESLADGLYSVLTGKFDDIGAKFADMLARMAADAAAAQLANAMFGDFGSTGSIGGIIGSIFSGFDTGGYTGPGGRYEPAGIVHKGEGVLNQDEIRMLGGEAGFNALRRALRGPGHAIGGMGGRPSLPDFAPPRSGSAPQVNITINDSGARAQSPDGMEEFGRDIARYVDNRFRELQMQSHRQGGLDWQQRQGRRL